MPLHLDDEHMCSKHVEAWNKLTVKQKFCASSWLITEINIHTYVHQVAFFINFPIKLCVYSLLPAKYASPVCYIHWIFKHPKYPFFLQSKKWASSHRSTIKLFYMSGILKVFWTQTKKKSHVHFLSLSWSQLHCKQHFHLLLLFWITWTLPISIQLQYWVSTYSNNIY